MEPILWCFIASWSHIRYLEIVPSQFLTSNLGQGASPCQVRKAPAPALPLRVDVGHDELPLSSHDQLRVVLEVVHLGVVKLMKVERGQQFRLRVGINGPIGGLDTTGNG